MNALQSLAFFILLLAVTSCGRGDKAPPERSYPVAIGEAIEADVPIYIEAIGSVQSPLEIQIRPQVTGILKTTYVQEGQYVRAGDPLYLIDPRPYQAALDRAKAALLKDEAALEYAKITLERYKEVANKDYISKLNYEQYQANVQAAEGQVLSDKADIEAAELNVEWCRPVSPVTGKISQSIIDIGNLVVANDPNFITDVRQIEPIQVFFNIPQRDFVRVQDAQKSGTLKFLAILPQHSDRPREGEIFFVDNHIDQTTGTVLLKGQAKNDDEFLWPGEYVQVKLQLKTQKNAILVPEEAVQIGQEGPFVYLYDANTSTVEYRKVTKGPKLNHSIVIDAGVKKGDKVITKGTVNLRPGSKVYLPQQGGKNLAWED